MSVELQLQPWACERCCVTGEAPYHSTEGTYQVMQRVARSHAHHSEDCARVHGSVYVRVLGCKDDTAHDEIARLKFKTDELVERIEEHWLARRVYRSVMFVLTRVDRLVLKIRRRRLLRAARRRA